MCVDKKAKEKKNQKTNLPGLEKYLDEVRKTLLTGKATEKSFYPYLKKYILDEFFPSSAGYRVMVNPPKNETGFLAILVQYKKSIVGRIECKIPFDHIERKLKLIDTRFSQQVLHHEVNRVKIIVTDFLTFWAINPDSDTIEILMKTKIGTVSKSEVKLLDTTNFFNILEWFKADLDPSITELDEFLAILASETNILFNRTLNTLKNGKDPYLNELKSNFTDYLFIEEKGNINIQFSDFFAQVLVYGHFLGWFEYCRKGGDPKDFDEAFIQRFLPKSVPLLQKIFDRASISQNIKIECIDKIMSILRGSDFNSLFPVLEKPYENVILNFYEKFLSFYNRSLQLDRGTIYTPIPVTDFIINGIDIILREKFGFENGILSNGVKYLDPAAGTLTFPARLAVFSYGKYKNRSQIPLFKKWIQTGFLPHVYAFEIMIAPFVLGHVKMNMILKDLGYELASDEQLMFYLTNTLIPLDRDTIRRFKLDRWSLSPECLEADRIHEEEDILVIMGNPPYNTSSKNQSTWIEELVNVYKIGMEDEINLQRLSDDYVRFIRFAHWKIDTKTRGIIGFITNNAYLDSRTFKGMRRELFNSFDEIYIIDLHGNLRQSFYGEVDENIFPITVGIAIVFLIKYEKPLQKPQVYYHEIFGLKEEKLNFLEKSNLDTVDFKLIDPKTPDYYFIPRNDALEEKFENFLGVDDIFYEYKTGTFTHRDKLLVSIREDIIKERLVFFFDRNLDELADLGIKISDTRDWRYEEALRETNLNSSLEQITSFLYRGFDHRLLCFDPALIDRGCDRKEFMDLISDDNPALLLTKAIRIAPYNHVFITSVPYDANAFKNSGVEGFPLYKGDGTFNIKKEVINQILEKYSTVNIEELPEKLFYYIYGVFFSPTYRKRYVTCLRYSYPRIPLPDDVEDFKKLSNLGRRLAKLHLPDPNDSTEIPAFSLSETLNFRINKYYYDENEHKIYFHSKKQKGITYGDPKSLWIGNVTKDMWNFSIGGIPQIEQWLKSRKKVPSPLKREELTKFLRILEIIQKTIKILPDIEEAYLLID